MLEPRKLRLRALHFLLRKLPHLGIAQQLLCVLEGGFRRLTGGTGLRKRTQLPRLPVAARVQGGIGIGLRLLHTSHQFLILIFHAFESVEHGILR